MAEDETAHDSTENSTGWPAQRADGAQPEGCDALPRITIAAPAAAPRRAAEVETAPELPSDALGAALRRMDPAIDSHWTSQGLPRLDVVSSFAGWALERQELPPWNRQAARSITRQPGPEPAQSHYEQERQLLQRDFDRRLHAARQAEFEHAALGPFASRLPMPRRFDCPFGLRIAAENRAARRGR